MESSEKALVNSASENLYGKVFKDFGRKSEDIKSSQKTDKTS
jgi:hypothetical protein